MAKLRSRNFSKILSFSEKLSAASFSRLPRLLIAAPKILALELLPLRGKAMASQNSFASSSHLTCFANYFLLIER